jgi:hypothetical protein
MCLCKYVTHMSIEFKELDYWVNCSRIVISNSSIPINEGHRNWCEPLPAQI